MGIRFSVALFATFSFLAFAQETPSPADRPAEDLRRQLETLKARVGELPAASEGEKEEHERLLTEAESFLAEAEKSAETALAYR